MFYKRLAVALLSLVVSINLVWASEQQILIVTNDVDQEVSVLSLVFDENEEIEGLKMVVHNGPEETSSYHGIEQLEEEIVLKVSDGHKVISLASYDFDAGRGGHIQMKYLSNGIFQTRKKKELKVEWDSSAWGVYYEGVKVTKSHIEGRYMGSRLIGIKRVTFK